LPECELTQGPSTSQSTQGPSTSLSTQGPSTSETVPQTTSGPSRTSRHHTNGQTTLSGYFNQTKPLNVNHQKRIDHQLMKMIVKV